MTPVLLARSPAMVTASTATAHAELAPSLPTTATSALPGSSDPAPTASRTALPGSTSTWPPRPATLVVMVAPLVFLPLSAPGVSTHSILPSTASAGESVPVAPLSLAESVSATSEYSTSPPASPLVLRDSTLPPTEPALSALRHAWAAQDHPPLALPALPVLLSIPPLALAPEPALVPTEPTSATANVSTSAQVDSSSPAAACSNVPVASLPTPTEAACSQ